jgi:hypothetical protein
MFLSKLAGADLNASQTAELTLDQKLTRLETECRNRFDIDKDKCLTIDEARLAINFIVSKLFGSANHYFTDNHFKALFK